MEASPEKESHSINSDYGLNLEDDSPMITMSEKMDDEPPLSPASVDRQMSEDDSPSPPGKGEQLTFSMVSAEEEEDLPSPVAEDDDSQLKRRSGAVAGENGSSTVTSGGSGSWSSEFETSFKNGDAAPAANVDPESNGGDGFEEEDEVEYEIMLQPPAPMQQAEEEYEVSLQPPQQQAEGGNRSSLHQTAEKVVVEQENGAVQSYSRSEEKRAAYTSEGAAFVGSSSNTEIEWSKYDVNKDYLASRFKDVDIDAFVRAAFQDKQIQGQQIEYREGSSVEEIGLREGETVIYEAEESDEEVVELEFDAAVEKIHTHDDYGMYCPNCSNRITRVVLRRKIKQRRVLVAADRNRRDLLGCLSCFSIFILSGNKLNPFQIFGGKRGRDETTQFQEEQLPTSAAADPSSDANIPSFDSAVPTPASAQVEERKVDCFWFLKKRRVDDQSESDLTSPLLQESSRDEAIEQEGRLQTSTTTVTSESTEQSRGGLQTSITTVTSESRDTTMNRKGEVQTSTTTVTSESSDTKQGGKVHSSSTSTTTVTSKPRAEAIQPAVPTSGGNIQVPQEQPVSDGTTVVATDAKQVKAKGFDMFWFLKKGRADESDLRTPLIPAAAQISSSSTAFSSVPGIMPASTTMVKDDAIKQEGKLHTSTTMVTSKTRDEAIAQEGFLQTSKTTVTSKPEDEATKKQGTFQGSTRDEVLKQDAVTSKPRDEFGKQGGTLQTTTTTVTSKPGDEAMKQGGMYQTSETTVVSWQSDEAFKKGYAVSQQEKDNKSVGTGLRITTTENFRGETVGKSQRVDTASSIGKFPQATAQQDSRQDSVTTTETTRVETMQKPERVAIASTATATAAAMGSVPHLASQQESILDRTVITDVYGKQGEFIRQAKAPMQPQLQIRGAGPSEGGDVRITVEETRVETQTIGSTDVAASTARTEIVTESRPSVWFDILKSIVYGGLMESVISLFVVSLAIGSNATSMNVVAIGSAFVVGGFILLLHDLRILKYGDSSQTSEQRYEAQLGRIERFPLHALVAVVSHIVFGLIPPVIFGFTFPGDIEFKMISVGAASFICIFILAISQAYVRGERTFMAYFKTVLYYVFLAAIVSGAAFGIAYLLQDPFPCPAGLEL